MSSTTSPPGSSMLKDFGALVESTLGVDSTTEDVAGFGKGASGLLFVGRVSSSTGGWGMTSWVSGEHKDRCCFLLCRTPKAAEHGSQRRTTPISQAETVSEPTSSTACCLANDEREDSPAALSSIDVVKAARSPTVVINCCSMRRKGLFIVALPVLKTRSSSSARDTAASEDILSTKSRRRES